MKAAAFPTLRLAAATLALAACSADRPRASPSVAAPSALAQTAPTVPQLVAARQAGMHMAATLLYRGIKAAVRDGTDVKEQVHQAEGLEYWAVAIPGLFPPGSTHPQSRALPAIWANKPDFDRRAGDLRDAAAKLVALAKAGDKAGFAAGVPAVEGACNACHTAYRAK